MSYSVQEAIVEEEQRLESMRALLSDHPDATLWSNGDLRLFVSSTVDRDELNDLVIHGDRFYPVKRTEKYTVGHTDGFYTMHTVAHLFGYFLKKDDPELFARVVEYVKGKVL